MGPGQMGTGKNVPLDKWAPGQIGLGQMGPEQIFPGQMGPGQMGPRTNRRRTIGLNKLAPKMFGQKI